MMQFFFFFLLMFNIVFNEGVLMAFNKMDALFFIGFGLGLALMMKQMYSMNKQLVAAKKEALTDPLTDLLNYRAIVNLVEEESFRLLHSEEQLTIVFFDIDYFKRINDAYGHAVGDIVLHELGDYIKYMLRGKAMLGRFGGDEFVIVLPNTNANQSKALMEIFRGELANTLFASKHVKGGVKVTISSGTATYPEDGSTFSELLNSADQAMYLAKTVGSNRVYTGSEAKLITQSINTSSPGTSSACCRVPCNNVVQNR